MYGYRARIGYTSPPIVTEVFPYEFYKMAPEGVTLVLTTLMVARHTPESGEAEESWQHSLRAAREMARAGVDIIVLGGAPVVYGGGGEGVGDRIAALSKELGVPVTDSGTAYHQADLALGARLVGAITYASAPGSPDHLSSPGNPEHEKARIIATGYAGRDFIDVGRIDSEVPMQMARDLKRDHPEIDTIHLGSPHWACGAIIDQVEQGLAVNVVQGSQAILWWALRSLGIEERIDGYGRLLRDH
jgi:maleate isomerase